jgi:hypothetical protein
MVMNNISFMDEFAMMDYDTLGGGGGENITPVYLNLDFTQGTFDSRITFFENGVGGIVNSQGILDYNENNLVSWSDYGWTGWGVPSGATRTEIADVDGNPQRGARITFRQAGSSSLNFQTLYKTTSKSFIFWIRGSTSNIGNCGGAVENEIEVGTQTPNTASNGGFDGPIGTPFGTGIWGFSNRGTCDLIGGFTSGVIVDKLDPSFRPNLWRIRNISTTEWTKVKVTNYDSVSSVNIYFGTSSLGVGATYTFDMCQLQVQAGQYDKGYRRTRGSPYYGPKITSGSTGGATLGWLLEPEKKNLLTNSMNMSSSGLSSATGWTLSRTGITWTTDILCPAGFSDGYKLFDTTDNATHRIVSDAIPLQISIHNATVGFSMYTASAFVKSGGITNAWLQIGDPTETALARAVFDIQNFTVGATSSQNGITMIPSMAGLERYDNGWARIYMTALVGTGSSMRIMYGLSNSSSNVSYAGTGTGFIYIWGPQFETGYFPTTYMPSGNCTSNSFTLRSANTAVMGLTGNSIYAVPEFGTVYCSYYTRNYVFPNTVPRIANLTLATASSLVHSIPISTNNTPSAYAGSDTIVNSTGPGAAGTKSISNFIYWNGSAANSPPVYNKLFNLAASFRGLSGSSGFAWMALNGITGANSFNTTGNSFGGTLSIPLKLDFNNRNQSNPDGHAGVILKSYSFVPQFTDQNILVQRTL